MFTPCNRYLLVERNSPKSEEESLVILPEGAYQPESRYERVYVRGISSEIRPPITVGHHIVVLSHMIEEVDFGEEVVYLVLENHVLGIVE